MIATGALLALALLAPDRPFAELPYTPGLDVAAMDRSADPCVDFYAFSCGGWKKRNPIPPDQSSWSVYAKTATENHQFLWGLLEAAAARPDAERTPEERKVGDFFHACMDEATVEAAGLRPVAGDLAAIDALRSKAAIPALVARLHLFVDGGMLFGFGSAQSFDDSDQVVAWISAGGLGLPDRDYYLKDDPRSKELRKAYEKHVAATLRLSGLPERKAAEGARTVLRIETALARASLTKVERRDPRKIWHPTPTADLTGKGRAFGWKDYLALSGAPPADWVNVSEPAFLAELDRQLAKEPLSAWKTYLRWHLVRAASPYLSTPFQKASFGFYAATLRGAKELAPRWKRCVRWTDAGLGEALGQVFVTKVFPPSAKADAERLVRLVQEAMAKRIDALDWMEPATRKAAHEKLAAMRNKIGYPDRWRDYSAVVVKRDDLAGNVARASAFETRRQLAKIGKPVDRGEWGMTPPTVNAYYDSSMNDMNFPAGVLLPPLWDPRMDLAPGYGNTGGTVGHELIHGFDDEGRQFDAKGNLRDWWTEADGREFEKRAACVSDQYGQYVVVDDVKINSKLTLGEDIADLAGVLLAWDAWKLATAGQTLEPRDGLTPDQRFFVGFAQWVCANERPEDMRVRAATDPHSPPVWRVNGVVPNVPEFAKAFSCKAGQPMVRENVCRIW
ncbi:MAG TPA: M13 family metallopeptidase [Anaeromyxobacteraceae bacterium]|nr:M13 family metallopeptidase [Anaeromyxobacteraceae bacterium]